MIKSLTCLLGRDNGERFLAIVTSTLLLFFILASNLFTAWWAQLIWAVPSVVMVFCTTMRRVRDAGRKIGLVWLFVGLTGLSLLLPTLLPLITPHWGAYSPLLMVVFVGLYLFSLPAKDHQRYGLGYVGPIDLSAFASTEKVSSRPLNARVEPVLFAQTNSAHPYQESMAQNPQDEYAQRLARQQVSEIAQWRQDLYQWFSQHRKLSWSLGTTLSLCIATALAWPYLPAGEQSPTETAALMMPVMASQHSERNHRLAMPDDFYLLLNEHNGLIVHWQADIQRDGEIWSLASATGDDTCQFVEFNNGDKIRALNVTVENGGDYFANFSPLDTHTLVESLANRGNFGLCGYTFSLKGSLKALSSHPVYLDLVD
ncbi:hypothetical protein [Thalassotalea mangrovi]|uniref:DUF805 domain-containing protein n=1 Tax=Thalassotalea mangrovi TaxID=2572245 RepID=A0A4U1B9C1_9GAMM|nr:hypothetical protein [Thalassotalea mangrovi]TKB46947.1 hypothetical protein E8M12_03120 [Thalassotalea mangrovi]